MRTGPDSVVPIQHDYSEYNSPRWVEKTVVRLLDSLSTGHVAGLCAVVLTESAKVGRARVPRSRGRKYQLGECLGYYRRAQAGEPAAVLLIVDNLLQAQPRLHWLQFARDSMLADVLYHEIGHHLHATVGSHAAGSENSADAWGHRLWRIHLRRRYWYLRPLAPLARFLARMLRRRVARNRG